MSPESVVLSIIILLLRDGLCHSCSERRTSDQWLSQHVLTLQWRLGKQSLLRIWECKLPQKLYTGFNEKTVGGCIQKFPDW